MIRKKYILFTCLIILGLSFVILQLFLIFNDNPKIIDNTDVNVPVILWWTPFGNNGLTKACEYSRCYFTSDRTFETNSRLKGILFYGSNFKVEDLPNWKSPYVQWGLMNEESPRNNPLFVHEETLQLFNYSSTFSRFSDVPLTLMYLPGISHLLGKRYFVSTRLKNIFMREQNLAPLLYIQSNCDTASDRDSYITELMKYIRIDSYGLCLNNAQLNERLKGNYLNTLDGDDFLSFVAKYKFTIAFENAVCDDYITEKLWRPLIVGSIPIYYGSPSFKNWLPNNKSAVSVLDFSGPDRLADFLLQLSNNDSEYEQYLSHKLDDQNNQITNYRLLRALEKRSKKITHEFGQYVEEFECFVCNSIYHLRNRLGQNIISKNHYNCPLPKSTFSNQITKHNAWVDAWNIEKCGAKLLAYHVRNNITIDIKQYTKRKLELYIKDEC